MTRSFFLHAAVDAERMEALACFDGSDNVAVKNENGMIETVLEIPAELASGFGWPPLRPLYLLCCLLPTG
jgi:hypothetical protein